MSEGQDSWHGGRPTPFPWEVLDFLCLTLAVACLSRRGVLSSAQLCSVHTGCLLPEGPEWLAPVYYRAGLLCLPLLASCLGLLM